MKTKHKISAEAKAVLKMAESSSVRRLIEYTTGETLTPGSKVWCSASIGQTATVGVLQGVESGYAKIKTNVGIVTVLVSKVFPL